MRIQKWKINVPLAGESGCGKTYSAMLIAQGLGGRTAVIATEGGRAQFHINDYGCENMTVYPLSAYTTSAYIALIQQLEKQYDNFLIDSATDENDEYWRLDYQRAREKTRLKSMSSEDIKHLLHRQFENAIARNSHCNVIVTCLGNEYVEIEMA